MQARTGLQECGLGYRAKYVQATAKKIYEEKIDLEDLKNLPYLEARKKLVEFSGVGLKVADCVLLFSLEKMEAFPVDVWVKRVILNHYADQLARTIREETAKPRLLNQRRIRKNQRLSPEPTSEHTQATPKNTSTTTSEHNVKMATNSNSYWCEL